MLEITSKYAQFHDRRCMPLLKLECLGKNCFQAEAYHVKVKLESREPNKVKKGCSTEEGCLAEALT